MNIQGSSSLSYMNQVSSIGNYNRQNIQSTLSSTQNDSDEVSFSREGQAMSRMLKQQESSEVREAHKSAFQEAFAALDLENIDTENMTDEEMTEVLQAFESAMSGHMHEGFKPASEMDSSELTQTISNIKDMASAISSGEGNYGARMGRGQGRTDGPPPQGGKDGLRKAGGTEKSETTSESDLAASLLEALEESEDEESTDLATQLLEALQESEQQNMYTSNRSMAEMMSLLNQAV